MGGTCWAYDSGVPDELRKALKPHHKRGDIRECCLLEDCYGERCREPDHCAYGGNAKGFKRHDPGKTPGPAPSPRRGLSPFALAAPRRARRLPKRPRRR
jgi:hypothetical protein